MRSLRVVLLVLVLLAAACGDNDKDGEPPVTDTTSSTSTSSVASTTTIAPSTTTSTSSTVPPTTSTTVVPATVFIDRFTGPPSPVECNAPTMEELAWTTRAATKVELFVGTRRLGQYPNGSASELVPLRCDGSSRTYTLKATKGRETVERSITLTTKIT
jgi:hypothetical protein